MSGFLIDKFGLFRWFSIIHFLPSSSNLGDRIEENCPENPTDTEPVNAGFGFGATIGIVPSSNFEFLCVCISEETFLKPEIILSTVALKQTKLFLYNNLDSYFNISGRMLYFSFLFSYKILF